MRRDQRLGACSVCCHAVAECRLKSALTLAAQLPVLTCLPINGLPTACERATVLLLARLTNLICLELPSQCHHGAASKERLTQMTAASAEQESADQGCGGSYKGQIWV